MLAAAHRVARAGLWLGGLLILLAALLIGVDVALRKLFVASIGGADELAGYALAIGTAWSLAAALLDRAHIRIDSFYLLLPGPVRAALDLIGLALFVGFFALVGWHGIGVLRQSWASGSRSQSALETPLVLPQALWLAGLLVFVAIGAVLFLAALGRLLAGDRAAASRLVGTRSAQEEVEEEMRAAAARREAVGP
ncbi:TRAP transporter small permease subunit [Caldovatus aquaticus]|uniref:TRAP transporter small permease protein n=1 Tax=Caldovatus aquaticus TaxID=2865671 RepID=A0ABS7F0S0_9PROT|nr:TRAP transporter small permease [Caldovatus aquaticus]MBW8269220.1 TRAP transporter small permease [Caldovatus aquaticus]